MIVAVYDAFSWAAMTTTVPLTTRTFPAEFLWGTASAAHQVEGGNTNNDYYEWELNGRLKYAAGLADDEYHRYVEDFATAASLGHNAIRLSIEWSRIEPRPNEFSDAEIAHYRDVLTTAHADGLKTYVTLHHFTNPIWAAAEGGWAGDKMVDRYSDYVRYVVPRIGDLVDYWLTINEPNANAFTSYGIGATPPGVTDTQQVGVALANFLKAHAAAYRLIHSTFPQAKVSLTVNMIQFDPARWWMPADKFIADALDDFWNRQILDSIRSGRIRLFVPFQLDREESWPALAGTMDFVAIDYYTRFLIRSDPSAPGGYALAESDGAHADNGSEVYPAGLLRILRSLKPYGLPIHVTENGVTDAQDHLRGQFICDHVGAIAAAIDEGVDVRAYLHWSLVDNYEWVYGFTQHFGLIAVDLATQQRTVRASAYMFSRIIASRSVSPCTQPP